MLIFQIYLSLFILLDIIRSKLCSLISNFLGEKII